MPLAPLMDAGPAIQVHVASALGALVLGALVLWRRKGTALHRALGRAWVVLMAATATSALFIHEMPVLGPFGPIHIFVPVTVAGLGQGLWAILVRRDLAAHRRAMQDTYLMALVLAGTFTLLPGRRMSEVLFGPDASPAPSWAAILAILAVTAVAWWRMRRPDRAARGVTAT